jgi:hypothetical protein
MVTSNRSPHPIVLAVLDTPLQATAHVLPAPGPTISLGLDEADVISPASIGNNQVLQRFLRTIKDAGGRLHLIGLLSDAGIHASWDHLRALIEVAKEARVRVVVHALLDGVDVAPRSAARYIAALEAALDGGVGRIGTVSGRALGMDAEVRWERIEKVYKAILADGVDRVDSAQRGVDEACRFGNPETFVTPFVVFDYPGVSLVDGALHFHFAGAGAFALSTALAAPSFRAFGRKRGRPPFEGRFASLTPLHPSLPATTLFPRAPDLSILPLDVLTRAGRQVVVSAQGTPTELARNVIGAMREGHADLLLADFGNPENEARCDDPRAVASALGLITESVTAAGGRVLVLGGRDGLNRASLAQLGQSDVSDRLRLEGSVYDLAPTLLALLQVDAPRDLEGASLLPPAAARAAIG